MYCKVRSVRAGPVFGLRWSPPDSRDRRRGCGTRQELCRIRSTLNSQLSIANCAPAISALANPMLPRTGRTSRPASSAPNRAGSLEMQTHQLCPLRQISPLEYALTKNALANLLESALTELLDFKLFRFRTYKKRGGGGCLSHSENHQPGARECLLRLAKEFNGIGSYPGIDGVEEACKAGASCGLRRWGGGGRGGPIGPSELHAPETRRRGEELDADALSLLRGIAQKHDAAFLLFLGEGVDQHNHRAVFDRLVQIEQPAVRIDDNRFASLADFPAVEVLAGGHDAHAHEHA